MALLVNIKGSRSSLVCKDKLEDVEKRLEEIANPQTIVDGGDGHQLELRSDHSYITFTGWHGKRIIILQPFDNLISMVEEKDDVVEKQQALEKASRELAEKKQREEIAKAGGKIELINMFPNKKKTPH